MKFQGGPAVSSPEYSPEAPLPECVNVPLKPESILAATISETEVLDRTLRSAVF
jgi:hypothetical protein